MACMTLFAPMAAATTQFVRAARYEISVPQCSELYTQRHPLRMNWVAVTGDNHVPGLRMHWTSDDDSIEDDR